MLEYKAARHGRTFTQVNRAFPSSQICSACGHRDGPKPLHIRQWTCGVCGTVHDRGPNAANNISFEGRRIVAAGRAETPNACGAPVRRAHVPAQRGEAGSPRKGQGPRPEFLASRTGARQIWVASLPPICRWCPVPSYA
ncbi:zinc ribbon domain-containing protein [Streptomyces massasporeus]|uniref:zinc ribbon domain-containing protein n=1 Tax=Streptomyces massasporeus TaxID=67324 RepID=UPI003F4CDA87